MAIAVKDLSGKVCFYLDGEVARDESGEVVGEPTLESVKKDEGYSRLGAALLSDRGGTPEGKRYLMDLAIGDVATARTVAMFGGLVDGCVADVVARPRLVDRDRGVWYAENTTDMVKVVSDYAGASGAPAGVVNPSFTPTTFVTTSYAVTAKIPSRTLANSDWDLRASTLRLLCEALRLRREVRLATYLTTAANWNAANQITPVAKWNGGATADPLTDLFAAKGASAFPLTHMVLSENLAPSFYANSAVSATKSNRVRDFVQAGGDLGGVINAGALWTSGGLNGYVWAPSTGNANVPLVRIASDPTMLQTAMTFRWLGESQDGIRSEGVLVRNYEVKSEDCWYVVATYSDYDTFLTTATAPPPQIGALIVGAQQ